MVSLFNGCSRSNFIAIPNNWDFDPEKALEKLKFKSVSNTIETLLSTDWFVSYRFYDPVFKGTDLWGKKILFRVPSK